MTYHWEKDEVSATEWLAGQCMLGYQGEVIKEAENRYLILTWR
jgi:hypothetical protein